MTKYGKVALEAVRRVSPVNAWDKALAQLGIGEKACPRTVFLGLCEDGYIQGIPKGKYLDKNKDLPNKKRAIALVKMLSNEFAGRWPKDTNDNLWAEADKRALGGTGVDKDIEGGVWELLKHYLMPNYCSRKNNKKFTRQPIDARPFPLFPYRMKRERSNFTKPVTCSNPSQRGFL